MGRRTSAARSIPGNPLGGVLRATQRGARTATRRPASQVPQPEQAEQPCEQPLLLATVLQSGSDGVVWWQFPVALPATPVITATVVASLPHTATIEGATPHAVALRVWNGRGEEAAGVPVHLTAFVAA